MYTIKVLKHFFKSKKQNVFISFLLNSFLLNIFNIFVLDHSANGGAGALLGQIVIWCNQEIYQKTMTRSHGPRSLSSAANSLSGRPPAALQ